MVQYFKYKRGGGRFFKMSAEKILQYGVRVLIIFMILPVHEFAHAFAAKKFGDRTAESMGRLTLNPISHIDIFGAICLVLTGFGWAKPVPVNPNRFKNYKLGSVITALAGPLSNVIVGYIGFVILKIIVYTAGMGLSDTLYYIKIILFYFIIINLSLAVFNLLPIPPLDGSRILTTFLPLKYQWKIQEYQMYISIVFIVIIFSGILDTPLNFLMNLLYKCIDFLTLWVDLIFG